VAGSPFPFFGYDGVAGIAGKSLYLSTDDLGGSALLQIQLDALTSAPTSQTPVPPLFSSTFNVFMDPAGKFIFLEDVAAGGGFRIYQVDVATGIPTQVALAVAPRMLALDPQGQYFAAAVNSAIEIWRFDATSLQMTRTSSIQQDSTDACAMAFDQPSRNLYVTYNGNGNLAVHSFDRSTGQLTAAPSYQFNVGASTCSVTVLGQ